MEEEVEEEEETSSPDAKGQSKVIRVMCSDFLFSSDLAFCRILILFFEG